MTIPLTDPDLMDRLAKATKTTRVFSMPYIEALFAKHEWPVDEEKMPWPYKLDPIKHTVYAVVGGHSIPLPLDPITYATIEEITVDFFKEQWGRKDLTAEQIALDPRITRYKTQ